MRTLFTLMLIFVALSEAASAQNAMFFGGNVTPPGGNVTLSNSGYQSSSDSGHTYIDVTVGNTGDTVELVTYFCGDSSCDTTSMMCGATASDGGTNTYNLWTDASINPQNGSQQLLRFYAKNATAGTYSVIITVTGTCSSNYAFAAYADLKGANTTAPTDTATQTVVNPGTTSGASNEAITTSAGNVSQTGEYCTALYTGSSNASQTGIYQTLVIQGFQAYVGLANPTSAATTSAVVNYASSGGFQSTLGCYHS